MQHKYWLAKRGCFDMLELMAEIKQSQTGFRTKAGTISNQITIEAAQNQLIMRAGIDPEDFDDLHIQDLLEVHNEVK